MTTPTSPDKWKQEKEAEPMLYQIYTGTPRRDMGGFGFEVRLWPAWKEMVKEWPHGQADVDRAIDNLGNAWLDACGYDSMTDPDQNAFDMFEAERAGKKVKLGPNARRLYEARFVIRVSWGEWGPEHISVPGNACGLDIARGLGAPEGGMCLHPHNVDNMAQAYLLMIVFNWFADAMIVDRRVKKWNTKNN